MAGTRPPRPAERRTDGEAGHDIWWRGRRQRRSTLVWSARTVAGGRRTSLSSSCVAGSDGAVEAEQGGGKDGFCVQWTGPIDVPASAGESGVAGRRGRGSRARRRRERGRGEQVTEGARKISWRRRCAGPNHVNGAGNHRTPKVGLDTHELSEQSTWQWTGLGALRMRRF